MNANIKGKKINISALTKLNRGRKGPASLDRRKARMGWLFVLPFVLGFIFVYLPIIYDSIRFSFNEITILSSGGYKLDFVGLQNYSNAIFLDTGFVEILGLGLMQMVYDIPSIILFSLFIAIILNQKIMGRAAFRAIFFIPVILTTGLISQIDANNLIFQNMSNTSGIDTGGGASSTADSIVSAMDIERMFSSMVVGKQLVDAVVLVVENIFDIVNRCGVQMLIFLAGLQSISPSIYESCQIDGASGWETFWKVTFPMVSPIILVNTVYTIIDSFTSSSNRVMTYINSVYSNPDNGNVLSSAMSWMYFLIVILIIAAVAGILSAFVFYQRRD